MKIKLPVRSTGQQFGDHGERFWEIVDADGQVIVGEWGLNEESALAIVAGLNAAVPEATPPMSQFATRKDYAASKDTERLDFMERHLCRAGEVKNDDGQTVKLCRVWSIMGELETLRETVDAMIEQTPPQIEGNS